MIGIHPCRSHKMVVCFKIRNCTLWILLIACKYSVLIWVQTQALYLGPDEGPPPAINLLTREWWIRVRRFIPFATYFAHFYWTGKPGASPMAKLNPNLAQSGSASVNTIPYCTGNVTNHIYYQEIPTFILCLLQCFVGVFSFWLSVCKLLQNSKKWWNSFFSLPGAPPGPGGCPGLWRKMLSIFISDLRQMHCMCACFWYWNSHKEVLFT